MIGVAKHTPFLAKFGAIRAVSHNTTSGLQINFYAGVTTVYIFLITAKNMSAWVVFILGLKIPLFVFVQQYKFEHSSLNIHIVRVHKD